MKTSSSKCDSTSNPSNFSTCGSGWKTIQERASIARILSTYILAQMLSFPNVERYQIGLDTFVKCIAQPENSIGNVLIIQGGVRHMDSYSYYVRTSCAFMSSNVRVFLYEKLLPVANFEFAHDIDDCLKFIREKYPGPTVVIGYSMGGILLYNYLSLGYDRADFYIPSCCPLDLDQFKLTINDHALFRMIEQRTLNKFGVNSHDEMLALAGTNSDEHDQFLSKFISRLNRHSDQWVPKTIYVVASDDPITKYHQSELLLLDNPPLTYKVEHGWHCCLNTIYFTVKLACEYLDCEGKVDISQLKVK